MKTLQGYVEWHIANTIQSIAVANKMPPLDIVLAACAVLFVLTRYHVPCKLGEVSIVDTLINLFTIISANTAAQNMVHIVTKQSSFDIFSALFIMTIILQSSVTFYKRVYSKSLSPT